MQTCGRERKGEKKIDENYQKWALDSLELKLKSCEAPCQ